jgi:hypothetical protein
MAIDVPENPDGGLLKVLYEKNSVKAALVLPNIFMVCINSITFMI